MEVSIERADDARIADYHNVADRELLLDRGLFVVEGRLPVRRLIAGGRFAIRSLLLSQPARRSLEAEILRLPSGIPVYVCSLDTFRRLTVFNLHRGCLALVERPVAIPFDLLVPDARTVVVLEAVADADNVGGVFRCAAAFGADAVLLSPTCCDPLYRKAVRTSMAAALSVPFARIEPWPAALASLHDLGFSIVALTPREPAIPLGAFAESRPPGRIALMVGAEGIGLSGAAESAADVRVRIPIRPDVDSLNLSVASGIALWVLSGLTRTSEP